MPRSRGEWVAVQNSFLCSLMLKNLPNLDHRIWYVPSKLEGKPSRLRDDDEILHSLILCSGPSNEYRHWKNQECMKVLERLICIQLMIPNNLEFFLSIDWIENVKSASR